MKMEQGARQGVNKTLKIKYNRNFVTDYQLKGNECQRKYRMNFLLNQRLFCEYLFHIRMTNDSIFKSM